MKVGVVTLPLHTNYGGILQAFALQKVLEDLGCDVDLLEAFRIPPGTFKSRVKFFLTEFLLFLHLYFIIEYLNLASFAICVNTNRFIYRRIHTKKNIYLDKISPNLYNAIIVGGDQVLRPKYFGNNRIHLAYLSFTKGWNIKRIIYGASFGSSVWEYSEEQVQSCKSYVKKFDFIGVREFDGTRWVQDYFDYKTACTVLDPTMLLDVNEYDKIISSSNNMSTGFIQYVLDESENTKAIIKSLSLALCAEPLRINSFVENNQFKLKDRIQPCVESWLNSIKNADFLITDSFHACVFSILFNRPFVVIGNESRGISRLRTLLQTFDLEYRLLLNDMEIEEWKIGALMKKPNVLNIVARKKEESLLLLKRALYG